MFALKKNQTSLALEVCAGLSTFFAMVYVLAVNPIILSKAGLPPAAIFTATAVGTIVATLIMAFYANLPFAVAPGMGLNAFFVVMVVQLHYTAAQALTAVLVAGILFVILSCSPLRKKFLDEVPQCLQLAVCSGIGLMLAYIGLLNSGVVVLSSSNTPALGDLSSGAPRLAVLGLLVLGLFLAAKFRYAVFASVALSTGLGIPLGVTKLDALKEGVFTWPPAITDLALNFDFSILGSGSFWILVVTLVLMVAVDSLAGFLGLFTVMGQDAEVYRHKLGRAFIADSMGVVIGSCLGLSPNTTYAESGVGVAMGGRTGLTALTVALGFALAIFIAPLFLLVPAAAVTPALIFVGLLMMSSIKKVDFSDYSESFPIFLVLILIGLTWRISDSFALGWLVYILMKVVKGRIRQISTTVWVVGVLFAIKIFCL
ncbi:MAG: NCS2 family permease [Deltaproteobacteria bacterium]|jgi:AGZA family xanthine/uracil permease-like MFS transporter|nr:NCS2 family permease [Deltaproteobacteria bacterium]